MWGGIVSTKHVKYTGEYSPFSQHRRSWPQVKPGSIKDALVAVERGAEPVLAAEANTELEGCVLEALGVVATRLEALESSNRELRSEVVRLRGEVKQQRALPEVESVVKGSGDGVLVRVARRLERLLGRRGEQDG